MNYRVRLAHLEALAAARLPAASTTPDDSPLIRDLPTILWGDPEAVAAFNHDMDLLTRHGDAAQRAPDPDAADAALRLYAVIPVEDETPEQWRARAARLPVEPRYLNWSASWEIPR